MSRLLCRYIGTWATSPPGPDDQDADHFSLHHHWPRRGCRCRGRWSTPAPPPWGSSTPGRRPTSSPRLSWTRRQESAPAPAERREAARVPKEAEAARARRMWGSRHQQPLRAVHWELHRPRRPLQEVGRHLHLQSRRKTEEEVKVKSCKLSGASNLAAWPAQCRLMCSDCRT